MVIYTRYSFKYFVFIILLVLFFESYGQEKRSQFIDSLDGAFDVSEFLQTKQGFLVVPGVITEPATGYGGYATMVWVGRPHTIDSVRMGVPSLTGVFGMGTENGTWGAGAFYYNTWRDNRYQYLAAIMKGDIKYDFYGSGSGNPLLQNPFLAPLLESLYPMLLSVDMWGVVNQGTIRLGEGSLYASLRHVFLSSTNTFNLNDGERTVIGDSLVNFVERQELESNLSELGIEFKYDTRDIPFTPTRGVFASATIQLADPWLGDDHAYSRIFATFLGYQPLTPSLVGGLRFDNQFTTGDVPFYAQPSVALRGVPLQRYVDNHTTMFEAELRQSIYKRWSVVGFGGYGLAYSSFSDINGDKDTFNAGVGFRYLLARLYGMHMGMDFAWSRDEFAFYFVFGSAWFR